MKKNSWLSLAFIVGAGCGHGPLPAVAAPAPVLAPAEDPSRNRWLTEEVICAPEKIREDLRESGWDIFRVDGIGRDEKGLLYVDFLAQKGSALKLGHATCDIKSLQPIEVHLYEASTHTRI